MTRLMAAFASWLRGPSLDEWRSSSLDRAEFDLLVLDVRLDDLAGRLGVVSTDP
jgi:hypothetical protein